jgi:hypothetical protein
MQKSDSEVIYPDQRIKKPTIKIFILSRDVLENLWKYCCSILSPNISDCRPTRNPLICEPSRNAIINSMSSFGKREMSPFQFG